MSMATKYPGIVSNNRLYAFTWPVFQYVELSAAGAAIGADVLVTTGVWCGFSHTGQEISGGYLRLLKAGGLRPEARPVIAAGVPAWATVNGNAALGMVTSVFAMQTAIAKPTNHGAAFIAINVKAMQPVAAFMQKAEALVDEIHQAPRADDVEQLFVSGEME